MCDFIFVGGWFFLLGGGIVLLVYVGYNGGMVGKVYSYRVSDIRVGDRRIGLDEAVVQQLMESIGSVGLLQPIGIRADGLLVYGYHRLEACRRLGWVEVPVVIVEGDDLLVELAEIDENLVRNELSVLERAEQLLRRKEIYERLYPEARAEVQRLRGMANLKPFRNSENTNASGAEMISAPEFQTATVAVSRSPREELPRKRGKICLFFRKFRVHPVGSFPAG